jgi:flagellar biosynthesis protein
MSTPDPPRRVAALRYSGEGAPKVVAAGAGALAERILARATEAGVPVREDAALAETLASLAVGDEVPEELWMAVARVLVWAYDLEGRITPNG